jgi:signal transduction histidine kinase
MVNIETKRETLVPQNFLKNLFKKGTLVCLNESDMFKGIVLLPEGSLIISSQPILTSEGNGPVRGTLIMGRYLDSELKHLSELTQLPIVSQRINDSNMSSDFVAAQSSILKDKPVFVNPLSENSIAGYALVRDIYGDPALILRVDLPRDIYHQGQSAIYYFSVYILLIGLIFAIVILFLLEKTFLSRIARLILDVRNIGLSGDVSMRIPISGYDEISSLSCNINDMLDKIDQSDQELRKAHDELEMRVKERTEELAGRNIEMERFIYTVSHDLRTPLISVSGLRGFLKQDAEKGDLEQMNADLRIANETVMNMDQLLLETLELSRIGRVVNPPKDVPFGEIVEDALKQTSEKIRSSGCMVSVSENLPVVHVDQMRITEVLVNLIENSLKYMGLQANPEIEIKQRIDGKDRIFFVRDNGIGIDHSQHDKVFELFYNVDKKTEGSGAGLAIVKRIIEVHGGRIWIESEMGQGCTICFTLPLLNVE